MFNEVIKLIKQEEVVNDYEVITNETFRNVFCELKSIGQKEFYQAQTIGVIPELCFVLSDYLDYGNEQIVEFNEVRYRVIRTYKKSDSNNIEIYVSRIVNEGDK